MNVFNALIRAASESGEPAAQLPEYAPLLLILPLAGFLFTAAIGRRLGKLAHLVPLGAIVATWGIAMSLAIPALLGDLVSTAHRASSSPGSPQGASPSTWESTWMRSLARCC